MIHVKNSGMITENNRIPYQFQ